MSDRVWRQLERQARRTGDPRDAERARAARERAGVDAWLGQALIEMTFATGEQTSSPVWRPELLATLARARALGAGAPGTWELLRAALADGTSRAALVLEALDVRAEQLPRAKAAAPGGDARAALERLVRERMGDEPLGTDHLLLALLQGEDCPVSAWLLGQGLRYRETLRVVRELRCSLP